MDDEPTPLAVTVDDAAALLSCSPEYVWGLLRDGTLSRVKLGKATRVDVAELRAFVSSGGTRGKGCYPTSPDQGAGQIAVSA